MSAASSTPKSRDVHGDEWMFPSDISRTFSSSLRLAAKLLASERRRAHSMGGGACLEGGGASAGDGVEWGSARRKASTLKERQGR